MVSSDPNTPRPSPALLQSLSTAPSSPLSSAMTLSTQLASFLLASLIRSSSRCKLLARQIKPSLSTAQPDPSQFFVPADGHPMVSPPKSPASGVGDDEDPPQTLLATLAEHLTLSFLSRSRAASAETERETREWDRLIVVYLALLTQWLWDDPKAVREFLENGGVGMVNVSHRSYI